ncbi:MAG: hypothetical protein ICV60_05280 [Pyrinomonadaceae bacterium]|nr:hypothetical protein [Pyrinomonadaceae bacterium]
MFDNKVLSRGLGALIGLVIAAIVAGVLYVIKYSDLERAASVSSILLSLIVGISVFFIWWQLKQQTRLTRVANTQELVGLSSPFSMQLIQDRESAELWMRGAFEYDRLDRVDKYRYQMMLYWWLIFHENVFYQRQNNLLDKHIYASWAYDLKNFVEKQRLVMHWPELRPSFQKEFRRHIDQLIENSMSTSQSSEAARESLLVR